ncbi:MAG: MotA/TolQ/ExbB proton channel family protein [Rhodospirillaceae bacterium]|nr:MAG: MotA/TolQ/ExbB proton channel family protein [Rhodospirillaceae bacterium]
MKKFCDRSGLAVRSWLTVTSVAAALALASASGAFAQQQPDASAAPAAGAAAPAPADATAAPPAADASAMPSAADAGVNVPTAPDKTEAANPYGLEALWTNGDLIARGTMIILVVMSMGTWYILFTRLWDQNRLMGQAKTARSKFWTAGSLKEGMNKLEKESAYRSMVEDGLKASEHHEGKMTDRIDLNEWVTMSLQRSYEGISAEMQAGLAFLASVGSTAPFVGLFGTVWGIYHALIAIGIAGQASIDKVAGPVGEALIMTAIGLAVAVPAVLGYNWLVRRNKVALEDVRNFSADIHAVLVSGARVG